MNGFDKFCAVLAFGLALALMILGAIGLFMGCSANFSLPPILGIVPGLIGWGIVRSVSVAWKQDGRAPLQDPRRGFSVLPPGTIPPPRPAEENAYNHER